MALERPAARPRRGRATAREQEQAAAQRGPRAPDETDGIALTAGGEALAMLRRRGFRPRAWPPDVPFAADCDEARRERLARLLDHYAFRLFLRGAIQRAGGFRPVEAARYVEKGAARAMAEALVALGIAQPLGRARYRLVHPPRSFGGTLEWYVARELRERLGFDTAANLRFGARGVGGDLDVVAAAEGRLVCLELKSSPPRQIEDAEVAAFFERQEALRPDLALFVVDTALRLSDKVVPMLEREQRRRRAGAAAAARVAREIWSFGPRLYAVNAKGDLLANVGRAIAEGLRAVAGPPL